jgi:hypothetical protein
MERTSSSNDNHRSKGKKSSWRLETSAITKLLVSIFLSWHTKDNNQRNGWIILRLCLVTVASLVLLQGYHFTSLAVGSNVNALDFGLAAPTSRSSRVFHCGYPKANLTKSLFPEFIDAGIWNSTLPTNENDIMVVGMYGPCDGIRDRWSQEAWEVNTKRAERRIQRSFQGKVLFVNGEDSGNIAGDFPRGMDFDYSNLYQIGPISEQSYPHSIRVYFIAQIFIEILFGKPRQQEWILDSSQRPKNTGKYHAMSYMTSRCTQFRQEAATQLSQVVDLHYLGRCEIHTKNSQRGPDPPPLDWTDNWHIYKNYKVRTIRCSAIQQPLEIHSALKTDASLLIFVLSSIV